MPPLIEPDFAGIQKTCDACGKHARLDRHHLARERLFIEVLKNTPRAKAKWYKKMVRRYNEFRPYDVRSICRECHKEVHEYYNEVLRLWNIKRMYDKRRNSIMRLSYPEIQKLKKLFREAYFEWREAKRKEGKRDE